MIKLLTIVGARPQFIKAAAISRTLKNKFHDKIKEVILHTGQHYDENMSQVFFDDLQIPKPDYNLHVGSESHGKQTAMIMQGTEEVILKEKPNAVLVYGDTNSTLAGSVAASKLLIPVIHVEAGLRSYNKAMPEEINRIVCDHVSTLLFCPTKASITNLKKEGFNTDNTAPFSIDKPGIFHSGDVMYDNSIFFSEIAEKKSGILKTLSLESNTFVLATIHRNTNTDFPERLNSLFNTIDSVSRDHKIPVIIPLHPRTVKMIDKDQALKKKISSNPMIRITEPVSFLDMTALEKNCKLIMTDSGGVQKEAFFFKKPCIILRTETEWVELVENGNNIVADADPSKIKNAISHLASKKDFTYPGYYGDGHAAEFICGKIADHIS